MQEKNFEQLRLMRQALSAVAEQLRGDLANLYGSLQFLAPPSVRSADTEVDRNAALLCHSYFRILRMVNNLSLLCEEEAPLTLENADLPEVIGDLCREVAPLAEAQGVTLTFSCREHSHLIGCNPTALRRICLNLLSNALKFTPRGGSIEVSLRLAGRQALVSVTDTGCGIPAQAQDTIFELHPDADASKLPHHGLGLGLPLCQLLARQQGGRLILQSDGAHGTTVCLALPDKRIASDDMRIRSQIFSYDGGFNQTLLELADALPYSYFTQKHLD
jgi:signal transduction histidine kinase